MRVRLFYQRATPRAWSRAAAITHVLAQRDHEIVAQEEPDIDVSTSYDVTVLIDWTPTAEPPKVSGHLLWDVPEDAELHVSEPRFAQWFAQIPMVTVGNSQQYRVLRGMAHQMRILPTFIPTPFLNMPRIDGRNAFLFAHPEDPYQDWMQRAHDAGYTIFTNLEIPGTVTVLPTIDDYLTALKAARVVLLPRHVKWYGDGYIARDAAYLGIPTIASKHYPAEVPVLNGIDDLERLSDQRIILSSGRRDLIRTWGVHQQAQEWWKVFAKLV